MVDLKSMSKKKRAEYIWEYYKLHIIGILAIIAILVSLVHSQLTKVDYVFNITMIGNAVDENKKENFEKLLTSIVVEDGDKRKQANIDIMPPSIPNNSGEIMPYEYMQRFILRMSAGEIDVIILDKSIVDALVKQDMLSRLDNISELDLSSIKNENKPVYAISAEDVKMFKDVGIDTSNKVMGIISTSKQKDKAALVIKWLLNK